MTTKNENLKENLENQAIDTSDKREWNAPDIKTVTPIKKTAGGDGSTGGSELGGYPNAS